MKKKKKKKKNIIKAIFFFFFYFIIFFFFFFFFSIISLFKPGNTLSLTQKKTNQMAETDYPCTKTILNTYIYIY